MSSELSHRERKKLRTREALAAAASGLFLRQGFEQTTVEQIAEEAGVSRRTFFRYFPAKEAVVFPENARRLSRFRASLREPQPGESGFGVVRRACRRIAIDMNERREEQRVQRRIIESSPALLAYHHKLDQEWEAELAATLLQMGRNTAEARRRARILAGAAMGAIQATLREWHENDAQADLTKLAEEAMELLARGFLKETER